MHAISSQHGGSLERPHLANALRVHRAGRCRNGSVVIVVLVVVVVDVFVDVFVVVVVAVVAVDIKAVFEPGSVSTNPVVSGSAVDVNVVAVVLLLLLPLIPLLTCIFGGMAENQMRFAGSLQKSTPTVTVLLPLACALPLLSAVSLAGSGSETNAIDTPESGSDHCNPGVNVATSWLFVCLFVLWSK